MNRQSIQDTSKKLSCAKKRTKISMTQFLKTKYVQLNAENFGTTPLDFHATFTKKVTEKPVIYKQDMYAKGDV